MSAAHVVVVFQFFDCQDDPLHSLTHRAAVLAAMDKIRARSIEWANAVSRRESIPRERIFTVAIDHEKADAIEGIPIGRTEFLGTRYDIQRGGLIVTKMWKSVGHHFFYADPPAQENIVQLPDCDDDALGCGLAYAFSHPPYGLTIAPAPLNALFERCLAELLGGISDKSAIFKWPTDWSNYFDAGRDWWGTFLWSVANPGTNRIAVISASTTD